MKNTLAESQDTSRGKFIRVAKAPKNIVFFVAVERNGSVRTEPVDGDGTANLFPVVLRFVDKNSYLMTDQFHAYKSIGLQYASHESVNHGNKEYARGIVHNNTAESFNAILERGKHGVFHYWSRQHLHRYLDEYGFRWNHRETVIKKTKKGKMNCPAASGRGIKFPISLERRKRRGIDPNGIKFGYETLAGNDHAQVSIVGCIW